MTWIGSAGPATDFGDPVSPWQRHEALHIAADALKHQGDLSGALGRYREAADLAGGLLDIEPAAPRPLRAMALSQQRISEVLIAQGELTAALDVLRRELDLRRRLSAMDAEDAENRAQLSRAAARVADILVLKSAIATSEGRDVAGAPTRRRPSEASWALRSAGNTLEARGDLAGALALYREGLAIRRRLAAQNPESAAWSLDVSWSLAGLGDALASQGDPAGALAAYRESLEIRRALSATAPDNDGLRCDVSASLARIAGILEASGDRVGALAAYRDARDIVHALCAQQPDRAEWRDDLTALDDKIAELAAS